MDEIANRAEGTLDVISIGNITTFSMDKAARDAVNAISDDDFEKQIADMPTNLQNMLRLTRNIGDK